MAHQHEWAVAGKKTRVTELDNSRYIVDTFTVEHCLGCASIRYELDNTRQGTHEPLPNANQYAGAGDDLAAGPSNTITRTPIISEPAWGVLVAFAIFIVGVAAAFFLAGIW